jgi:hypothetical protein
MPDNAESTALPVASLRKLVMDTITLHPELQESEPHLRYVKRKEMAAAPTPYIAARVHYLVYFCAAKLLQAQHLSFLGMKVPGQGWEGEGSGANHKRHAQTRD